MTKPLVLPAGAGHLASLKHNEVKFGTKSNVANPGKKEMRIIMGIGKKRSKYLVRKNCQFKFSSFLFQSSEIKWSISGIV